MAETATKPDPVKQRLRATWTSGDYGRIARGLAASAEDFLSRIPVARGDRVLDIACGAGQVAIPAARAGAQVTGIDLAEAWVEQARERAAAEGLNARFDVGDAEELPYADDAFDVTVSLIGAMFAPRPERVAAEMLRVTRRGGRIAMGNWPAEGFVAGFFRIVGSHVPPPDVPSPLLWGDAATVRERLGHGTEELHVEQRPYYFHYPMPPAEVVEYYRAYFGPVHQAFAALDTEGRKSLHDALLRHWEAHNEATDGGTEVTAELLEISAIKA